MTTAATAQTGALLAVVHSAFSATLRATPRLDAPSPAAALVKVAATASHHGGEGPAAVDAYANAVVCRSGDADAAVFARSPVCPTPPPPSPPPGSRSTRRRRRSRRGRRARPPRRRRWRLGASAWSTATRFGHAVDPGGVAHDAAGAQSPWLPPSAAAAAADRAARVAAEYDAYPIPEAGVPPPAAPAMKTVPTLSACAPRTTRCGRAVGGAAAHRAVRGAVPAVAAVLDGGRLPSVTARVAVGWAPRRARRGGGGLATAADAVGRRRVFGPLGPSPALVAALACPVGSARSAHGGGRHTRYGACGGRRSTPTTMKKKRHKTQKGRRPLATPDLLPTQRQRRAGRPAARYEAVPTATGGALARAPRAPRRPRRRGLAPPPPPRAGTAARPGPPRARGAADPPRAAPPRRPLTRARAARAAAGWPTAPPPPRRRRASAARRRRASPLARPRPRPPPPWTRVPPRGPRAPPTGGDGEPALWWHRVFRRLPDAEAVGPTRPRTVPALRCGRRRRRRRRRRAAACGVGRPCGRCGGRGAWHRPRPSRPTRRRPPPGHARPRR